MKEKTDTELFFEFLIIKGLERINKINNEKYVKRAKHEFDRIVEKNYINYFLVVWDYVNWAKKQGIKTGPGRGSASASLISHCLGMTDLDPIEYNLLFSRYLSPQRRDAPDFDWDVMDIRRDEVFDYLKQKYGENHCAKIVTYSRFHPKGIMRDMGRIFKIPISEIEKFNSFVLQRSGGDARFSFSIKDSIDEFAECKEFAKKYPKVIDAAIKLEGHIRHKGVHACAIIITEKDISSYVPINKVNDEIVTEWEKQLCEDMKLVKSDILGLKTLTVIDDAVKSSGCQLPKTFNDPKVYEEIFQKGNTLGLFQAETVAQTKFIQSLKVSNFNELSDSNSLMRPGPLHSGLAMTYLNRKLGKEKAIPFHPALENITKDTQHCILFQEQIMLVMTKVAMMSTATAEYARKTITKSKGKDAFNKMRADFVRGANKFSNMTVEDAEKLFDVVSTYGSYSFNKSHSNTYSSITYWTAWLKLYYKLHFFKAILKYENDDAKIQQYLQDASNNNIKINYPDINKSSLSYDTVDDEIFAGLNSIVGIGEAGTKKIIKNRPYASIQDFKARTKISDKLFKGLIIADAFRSFNINKQQFFTENFNDEKDFSEIEWAKLIYQYTTLKPKLNILKVFDFGDYKFINIKDLNEEQHGGVQHFLRGIVTEVVNKDKLIRKEPVKHTHHYEQHMIYLNLNDGTGDIACQLNPNTYEKYSELIQNIENQPIIVLGHISKDGKKCYVDMLQIINNNYRTFDIDNVFKNLNKLKEKEVFIISSSPAVSKNGKSYYRIKLSDSGDGLCFRFYQKLIVGMKVKYCVTQKPFINVEVIK